METIKKDNQAKLEGFMAETAEKEEVIERLAREKEELEEQIKALKTVNHICYATIIKIMHSKAKRENLFLIS